MSMTQHLLLSASALAASLGLVLQSEARVLRVPGQYPTIRNATVAAVTGDTILVAPGSYDEGPGQGVHLFRGVALLSEGGRDVTTVIGPGLEMGFDPPNQGCLVDGFRFTTEPDQGGVDFYNAGRGTTIAHCRFEGLRFGGNNFGSQAGLILLDSELFSYNIHLGVGNTEQTFSLTRNLIDGRNSDNTMVLYGSNEFVVRSNTVIAPRSAFTGDLPPTAHVEVVNNIFYARPEWTQEFGCYPPDVFDIRYNCLWNLVPVPPCHIGPTNIFADPRFCNFAAEDYRLQPDSPCAGAGENGVTMGAFGVGCGVTTVADASSETRIAHLSIFPNPVRHTAALIVDPALGSWALEIYDAQGRPLDVLPGDGREVLWTPPKSARNGVYFGRLRGAGGSEVVKFLILR